MGSQSRVELAVCRWSAWAPGLADASSWHDWAAGAKAIAGPATPDVRFVEPMLRRRLSFLSRMAFRVAADCLDGESPSPICVFCSRYGEIERSTEILNALARGEPAAPATFSLSVHNTSLSLLSIARRDTTSWTALAGGEATLETAFLEAWSQLQEGAATILLIYHDERLPPPFETQITSVHHSAAFALLLRLPEAAPGRLVLTLEWRPGDQGVSDNQTESNLEVLRLLSRAEDPVVVHTGRLTWIWSARVASA